MRLDVVCFKWRSAKPYRSTFGPATVNTLKRMIARHYSDHRFSCITDDPSGIDPDVRIIPLWSDLADVPNPFGDRNPSCYRRLKLFAPEAADLIGERFVAVDLDCVVTGDLRPLWDRPDPIVLWGDTHPKTHYNGSMVLMTAGARPQVWTTFDPRTSPRRAKTSGAYGSDQGWISYCLGPGEKTWGVKDGVYSYRIHVQKRKRLPDNARIVMFHGAVDPWSRLAQSAAWVREYYQ